MATADPNLAATSCFRKILHAESTLNEHAVATQMLGDFRQAATENGRRVRPAAGTLSC